MAPSSFMPLTIAVIDGCSALLWTTQMLSASAADACGIARAKAERASAAAALQYSLGQFIILLPWLARRPRAVLFFDRHDTSVCLGYVCGPDPKPPWRWPILEQSGPPF